MSFITLDEAIVDRLHDAALNPGELAGRAGNKSLDATLARVENRLVYGMIGDVYDLAASYAAAIAVGHCFNDGNKRTAFHAMDFCLEMNGVVIPWDTEEIGDLIIQVAQGKVHEDALAAWLRAKSM
jgi:death-on-curing protein